MTDYTSVRAKLCRAEKHLSDFEEELRTWVSSKPVKLVSPRSPKPNPDGTSKQDFYVRIVNPLPMSLNVIVGDCVHNFRCVLDHLVMALAISNGADPYDSTTAFPICGHPDNFYGKPVRGNRPVVPPRGTGGYAVRALRPAEQAFIEGLQPYNGKDGTANLTELQHLDNRDKHRLILETRIDTLATFHPPQGVTIDFISSLRLEDGAYFATTTYPQGYNGVQVQPQFAAGITVERSNRIGFIEIQNFLRDGILPFSRDILGEAERRFP